MYNPSVNKLSELFDKYNRLYFRGRLPVYSVRYVDTEIPSLRGQCDNINHTIDVRRGIAEDELRQLLLHEMCHIGAPSHGKTFLRRLQHLADIGEDWAKKEIELYKIAPTWNQSIADLRNTITDWSFEVDPSVSFDDILTPLAHDFGMTPEELLKSAPWVKAAWEKSRKEAMKSPERHDQFQT